MGNNHQGCTCMRPRERTSPGESWRHSFCENFEILYRKGHKWAEQICGIVILWDSRADKIFKNPNRWQFFMTKDCEKSALEYQRSPLGKNLFKELENDFKDSRNLIGAVLVQFSQTYANEYHDTVRDALKQDKEQCQVLLKNIVEDIRTVIEITEQGCLNFYSFIGKILKGKTEDLKGLILSQIISGDLYRIIYDLCWKINKELTASVRSLSSSPQELDEKTVQIFQQISVCESPWHKLQCLFDLKRHLNINENLNEVVWEHVLSSKVTDIFVHLYMVDLLSVEPTESSFDFFLRSFKEAYRV